MLILSLWDFYDNIPENIVYISFIALYLYVFSIFSGHTKDLYSALKYTVNRILCRFLWHFQKKMNIGMTNYTVKKGLPCKCIYFTGKQTGSNRLCPKG